MISCDETKSCPATVSTTNGGPIKPEDVKLGLSGILGAIFKKFGDMLKAPQDPPEDPLQAAAEASKRFAEFWKELMKYDHHSMRSYLLQVQNLDEATVEWLETNGSATGLYNCSFVEMVMDGLDFGSPSPETLARPSDEVPRWIKEAQENPDPNRPWKKNSWWCIDGGADILPQKMHAAIKGKLLKRSRVTKIQTTNATTVEVTFRDRCALFSFMCFALHQSLTLLIDDDEQTREYSQVICTIPLGCLAAVDFPNVEDLSYTKRLAIRSLSYDTSTKVALQFKTRWWEDPEVMPDRKIICGGGVSTTDLPIRCVLLVSQYSLGADI